MIAKLSCFAPYKSGNPGQNLTAGRSALRGLSLIPNLMINKRNDQPCRCLMQLKANGKTGKQAHVAEVVVAKVINQYGSGLARLPASSPIRQFSI